MTELRPGWKRLPHSEAAERRNEEYERTAGNDRHKNSRRCHSTKSIVFPKNNSQKKSEQEVRTLKFYDGKIILSVL